MFPRGVLSKQTKQLALLSNFLLSIDVDLFTSQYLSDHFNEHPMELRTQVGAVLSCVLYSSSVVQRCPDYRCGSWVVVIYDTSRCYCF